MKKHLSILSSAALFIALSLSVTGCSSSQTSDSEFGDDVPADAGTDAVPSEHAENAPTNPDQAQAPAPDQAQNPDQAQAQAQTTNPDPSQQVAAANPTDQQPPAAAPQDPNAVTPPAATTPDPLAQNTPPTMDTSTTQAPVAAVSTPVASTPSSDKPSGGSETYSVRHGDTLMRIAFEKYGDLYKWKQIYEANKDKIKDPNVIRPGTVLTLENVGNDLPARTGKKYMIKQGDTLARISNDVYGTPRKWKKIWEHNKPWIPNPNKIFAGFYLYYTGGKDPEQLEQHEEENNNPAPMAQDNSAPQTPRDPASTGAAPN